MARLDLDVDGTENAVYMAESYAEPISQEYPYGLSLVVRNVAPRTEAEGRQDMEFAKLTPVNSLAEQRHPCRGGD